MSRFTVVLVVAGLIGACSGGTALPTGPSPVSATVEFAYRTVGSEAELASGSSGCTGPVQLEPSWWGFAQTTMVSTGASSWGLLLENVPVGRHTVRLSALGNCELGSIAANGRPLTRADGSFDFTLHPDGSVTR